MMAGPRRFSTSPLSCSADSEAHRRKSGTRPQLLSPHGISFLTDGIILQRYVELEGQLRRFLVVAKMRGVDHKKDLMLYDIGPGGIAVGKALTNYEHVFAGVARLVIGSDDRER